MAKERVSEYARMLRELGFKPITELHSAQDIEEVDTAVEALMGAPVPRKMSRARRRQMTAQGHLPAFSRIDGSTQVYDEFGNEWWVGSEIDMTSFGFSDNVKELANLAILRKKRAH